MRAPLWLTQTDEPPASPRELVGQKTPMSIKRSYSARVQRACGPDTQPLNGRYVNGGDVNAPVPHGVGPLARGVDSTMPEADHAEPTSP